MIYRKSDTRPQKKVSESFQRSPDLQIKKGCCMMSPLSVQAKPRLFLATWDTCRFPLCERTNDAVNSTMARRGKRRIGTVSKSGCPRLAKVWKQSNKTKNPEEKWGESSDPLSSEPFECACVPVSLTFRSVAARDPVHWFLSAGGPLQLWRNPVAGRPSRVHSAVQSPTRIVVGRSEGLREQGTTESTFPCSAGAGCT